MHRHLPYLLAVVLCFTGSIVSARFAFPPGTSSSSSIQSNAIQIGLLIPDSTQTAVVESVRLAVDAANKTGGIEGTMLGLVSRSTEGPWGAGSKESVNLVYEDGVCAIIGALDGRNGHLAEQVATKSHLAYLETVATESTLSQAFVPYFMRCIPNDDQQARAIMDRVEKRGGETLAILSNDQYDNLNAARSFVRIATMEKRDVPMIIDLAPPGLSMDQLVEKLRNNRVKQLVIPFRTTFTMKLLSTLRQEVPDMELYGTLGFIADLPSGDAAWMELEGLIILSTGYFSSPEGSEFQKEFTEKTGYSPSLSAAFTYDGTGMLIEAIRRAGADREGIKDALASMEGYQGATGIISFDEMGNRKGPLEMMRIKHGTPVVITE